MWLLRAALLLIRRCRWLPPGIGSEARPGGGYCARASAAVSAAEKIEPAPSTTSRRTRCHLLRAAPSKPALKALPSARAHPPQPRSEGPIARIARQPREGKFSSAVSPGVPLKTFNSRAVTVTTVATEKARGSCAGSCAAASCHPSLRPKRLDRGPLDAATGAPASNHRGELGGYSQPILHAPVPDRW